MGGSPHSAAPRNEQGLSWILWLLDTETWYGDTRRTPRVATWLGQQRPILKTIREWDETEEPIYVFEKSDNEDAVVDSCCRVCDDQSGNAALESGRDARIKTRRDVDMRWRKRDDKATVNWRADWVP